ncbi:MAG TPA: hypothetical protein VKY92_04790 [Verrucomicrobiae bacterium]|nr:hypothetical protein [Verrucomicrobiae bacterium]
MSNSEEEILAREIGKVGGKAGPGASLGARIAARLLPTKTFSASLVIEREAGTVFEKAMGILQAMGEVAEQCTSGPGPRHVSAIAGSGFAGMNPAFVQVRVAPVSEHASEVTINAAAKEGLIPQRTAEKAAERFKEELLKACR